MPDVVDLKDAARMLSVSEETLLRWVRQGLIRPANPDGTLFEEDLLRRWAAERGLPIGGAAPRVAAPEAHLLASAVARGAVTIEPDAESASAVIAAAIAALPDLSDSERRSLHAQILDRERMASTALGHGVAIPHPRTPPQDLLGEPVVSVVFPVHPIDWAALDGEPVRTAFLVLAPSAPVHLALLSRIAYAIRSPQFLDLLAERPAKEVLVERLRALKRRD